MKRMLIKKAYDSLPVGGYIVVYDFYVDEDRREKAEAMMMSLHMQLVCTGNQFTFTEMEALLKEAGFS